ncbi:hypothetical protein BT67DRAFT_188298 [Trichocladium antarcticum]|uniref:Uncharacterized protein n=1 Tax=Trichocladium antarcticum TaxID=1450529 RepID=A0AAN6ZGF4_9PEZI|nr:hypothetical protein BT67DRAFT_188298 [Trichocladium antarcticum]
MPQPCSNKDPPATASFTAAAPSPPPQPQPRCGLRNNVIQRASIAMRCPLASVAVPAKRMLAPAVCFVCLFCLCACWRWAEREDATTAALRRPSRGTT